MRTSLTTIKATQITGEHLGLYVEVEQNGNFYAGGISDVQQSKVLNHRHEQEAAYTRLYIGGKTLTLVDDACTVRITAPADPCDGTPLTTNTTSGDPEPTINSELPVAPPTAVERAFAKHTRNRPGARGRWISVVGSAAVMGFGTSLALGAPPLTGGTFLGMALITVGGAVLFRVLHLAGAVR